MVLENDIFYFVFGLRWSQYDGRDLPMEEGHGDG